MRRRPRRKSKVSLHDVSSRGSPRSGPRTGRPQALMAAIARMNPAGDQQRLRPRGASRRARAAGAESPRRFSTASTTRGPRARECQTRTTIGPMNAVPSAVAGELLSHPAGPARGSRHRGRRRFEITTAAASRITRQPRPTSSRIPGLPKRSAPSSAPRQRMPCRSWRLAQARRSKDRCWRSKAVCASTSRR